MKTKYNLRSNYQNAIIQDKKYLEHLSNSLVIEIFLYSLFSDSFLMLLNKKKSPFKIINWIFKLTDAFLQLNITLISVLMLF